MKKRIDFLERGHGHNHTIGSIGEKLVLNAIKGSKLTLWGDQHDVVTQKGLRLEVKFARLSQPVKTVITLRWAWGHVLGSNNSKKYERLILIGVADTRYQDAYIDPTSPYVLFDLPFSVVKSLMDSHGLIFANSNPHRGGRISKALFEKYSVQSSDLQRRYGI